MCWVGIAPQAERIVPRAKSYEIQFKPICRRLGIINHPRTRETVIVYNYAVLERSISEALSPHEKKSTTCE